MQISVQELREKLIPKLCALKIKCRHCGEPQGMKVINEIQEWLDNLWTIEQGKDELKIMGEHKDWTR